jgi:hypothetical protein
MNEMIPIYEEGISWTDLDLEENFRNKTGRGKTQLMGLLAQRSSGNSTFLDILEKEAVNEKSREEIFFGFIKLSWIPVIAVLEYGTDEAKRSLSGWLRDWTPQERDDFLAYIAKESEFLRWFSEIA